MIAAREGPDVAVKVGKEFDDDGVGGLRDEVALRDFEFVFLKRTRFGEKLIAGSGSENQKVCGMPLAFDGVARLFTGGVHGNDVRAMHLAAGILGAFQEQAI